MLYNDIEHYSSSFCFDESEILKAIRLATDSELNYADMLSGKMVAGLLRLLIQTGGYENILEIGMFTGYATLAMAEVLPENGKITTLEMNKRYYDIAMRHFNQFDNKNKIKVIFGNARESCLELDETYDLIFLDADKQFYPEYFNILKPKLNKGGILFADNVFWSGKVLDQSDRKSKAIHQFNEMVKADAEMEPLMLTIRDGVLIARKR